MMKGRALDRGILDTVQYKYFVKHMVIKGTDNLRIHGSEFIKAFGVDVIAMFCHQYALYQLPTDELLDWLANRCTPDDVVVEIGAGSGQIGMNFNHRKHSRTQFYCTDNHMQERPGVMLYYALFGQRPIQYPPFVERYGALEAVDVYNPSIVFGAWVTQFGTADVAGHLDGVNYKTLFAANPCVKELILIGNTDTHKNYFQFEGINVEELSFPWLISRATNQENNRIWVVTRK